MRLTGHQGDIFGKNPENRGFGLLFALFRGDKRNMEDRKMTALNTYLTEIARIKSFLTPQRVFLAILLTSLLIAVIR